jgi:hypothetical protein
LDVKRCSSPCGDETFILCRSSDRRRKEEAIHERFEKRIEEGLARIFHRIVEFLIDKWPNCL